MSNVLPFPAVPHAVSHSGPPDDPVGVAVAHLCQAAGQVARVAVEHEDREAWVLFQTVITCIRLYEAER